jgi:hypothetical protein
MRLFADLEVITPAISIITEPIHTLLGLALEWANVFEGVG